MMRLRAVLCALCVLALTTASWTQEPSSGSVEAILRPVLARHGTSALGGAIVTSRGLVVQAVAGTRRAGQNDPVRVFDSWHLGSDTKAMTSTMIGTLVQEGRLTWTTTVGEVFGAELPGLSGEASRITLLQLLRHRSGLPANLAWQSISASQPLRAQRLEAVRKAFAEPRNIHPGAYLYSNLGYVVAAAMAEKRADSSWETLMEQRLFRPLGMHVGFGPVPPGEGPTAHNAAGTPAEWDNPAVISPAGRVHCSLADWAKFITDQLRGARGEKALLQPATYHVIQTAPPGEDYACGWSVTQRPWGGTVLTHAGSNTFNYCVVWISPEKDFAVLSVANRGGDEAFKACDETAWGLIQLWTRSAK